MRYKLTDVYGNTWVTPSNMSLAEAILLFSKDTGMAVYDIKSVEFILEV